MNTKPKRPHGLLLTLFLLLSWLALHLTEVPVSAQNPQYGMLSQDDNEPSPTPEPTPDLPPGTMLVEEDILIQVEEFFLRYPSLAKEGEFSHAPEGTYQTNLWPNGVVRYEFAPGLETEKRAQVQIAMSWWEDVANVDFVHCGNNTCSTGYYLHIFQGSGNWSYIGRLDIQYQPQQLSVVSWNSLGTIAHELGHALGLPHEQNRPDRNTFVTINSANICKATSQTCNGGFCYNNSGNRIDCDHNFAIAQNAQTYGNYDFGSIMHYRRNAFSATGADTITVKSPNQHWQSLIGLAEDLSTGDKNVMGCMYPRSNWRWLATGSGGTQSGLCLNPYRSLNTALSSTPSGGQLWIEPGIYSGVTTINRPMTLTAPNGTVTIR